MGVREGLVTCGCEGGVSDICGCEGGDSDVWV